jgi:hypothetical protein
MIFRSFKQPKIDTMKNRLLILLKLFGCGNWRIKGIFKTVFILILLVSCSNQDESLFVKEYKDLRQFALNTKKEVNGLEYIKSPAISNFLGLKDQFLYLAGGATLKEEFSYTEIIISSKKIKSFDYGKTIRYLFVEKKMNSGLYRLVDTLRIEKEFCYTTASLSTSNKSDAIVVGTCSINDLENRYLINKINKISKNGRLKILPIGTTVYDCPPPNDCFDDESKEYKFGVNTKRMMKRFWYELDRQNLFPEDNFLNRIQNNHWHSTFCSEFTAYHYDASDDMQYRIEIINKDQAIVRMKINADEEQIDTLYCKLRHPDSLQLLSEKDQKAEIILWRKNGKYFLAGFDIYMLTPGNTDYPLRRCD